MTASNPIDRRSLDLTTLATPGTIGRPGRLYGSVRDSRGLFGRRYFIASLPAGAAVFPLAAPGVAFVLIEEDGSPDGPWFVAGIPPSPTIEAWYGALLASPGAVSADSSAIPLAAGESRALSKGATVTARQVLWLKADRPALRYASPIDSETAPPLPLLVLADQVTATTMDEVTVQAVATEAISGSAPELLTAPLVAIAAQLGRHLLAHDAMLESRPIERRARDEAGVRTALRRLGAAASLRPVAALVTDRADDPLSQALAAIARHEGIKLRDAGRATPTATLLERLEAVGDASGFRVCEVALEPGWWKKESAPLIARTKTDDQPRAVLWRRGRWRLVEAVGGRETVVDAAVAARLAPVALTIHPTLPEQATPMGVGRFAFFGTRRDIRHIFFGAVGSTLSAFLIPIATGAVVGVAVPDARTSLLIDMMILLVAAAIGNSGFHVVRAISMIRLSSTVDRRLQPAVWDRVLRLNTSFFRRYTAGDLAARIMGIDTVRRMLSGHNLNLLIGSTFALTSLGIMLIYDAAMTAFAVGYALVAAVILFLQGRRKMRLDAVVLANKGLVTGLLMQILGGIAKLRVAAAEERTFARWSNAFTEQRAANGRSGAVRAWDVVISTSLPILGTLGVLAIAGGGSHPIDVAAFAAFNGAFAQFTAAIVNLATVMNAAIGVGPLLARVRPIFDAPLEVDGRRSDPGRLSGQFAVRNLWFRYADDAPWTLQDIDFEVRPGASIAFVGTSGSGKSTLLRLLLGFEKPQRGGIFYDGKDLGTLELRGVRRQVGTVLESSGLIPGTLYENISMGGWATREQAMEAVRLAGLEDDIANLPHGLDTMVTEGGGQLSGGQRQRVMIARALVDRPRLIMFDEATSALDNRTQAIVGRSLEGMNATRLIIAHRLSTIRSADHIIVLEAGRIVQQGSFDALVGEEGPFLRLVRRQIL
ncbi:NHLP bacteriocin export ABC transporter permease/ATPase subunit [Reyranella sp.]|uniref:NHLP bacteriocin export ABC transporter permease/ATPase subunit n=1 Tax=Reyranella sp. TaxID=1929291 RepID=UPI0040357588